MEHFVLSFTQFQKFLLNSLSNVYTYKFLLSHIHTQQQQSNTTETHVLYHFPFPLCMFVRYVRNPRFCIQLETFASVCLPWFEVIYTAARTHVLRTFLHQSDMVCGMVHLLTYLHIELYLYMHGQTVSLLKNDMAYVGLIFMYRKIFHRFILSLEWIS